MRNNTAEKPQWFIAKIAVMIWVIDIIIVGVAPHFLMAEFAFSTFDLLLASQIVASAFIIVVLGLTGLWREFGFVKPQGLMWLAWTAPFWLYGLSLVFMPEAPGPETMRQLALLIGLAVMVGFSEEAIYRGGLWEIMRPFGVWPTVLMTSIMFGAVHLVSLFWGAPLIVALSRSFYAFAAGLIFAAARLRSGSVLAPMAVHIAVDALAFAIFGPTIFENQEEADESSVLYAMIGFAIAPGIIFGLWGLFAIRRIQHLIARDVQ
ncbi:MAG: type II CAAX endopeptidase family protein [Pseudomonadota bacterium]